MIERKLSSKSTLKNIKAPGKFLYHLAYESWYFTTLAYEEKLDYINELGMCII